MEVEADVYAGKGLIMQQQGHTLSSPPSRLRAIITCGTFSYAFFDVPRVSVCCGVQVDDLDYAMRKKDATKANAAYAQVWTPGSWPAAPSCCICHPQQCFRASCQNHKCWGTVRGCVFDRVPRMRRSRLRWTVSLPHWAEHR